MEREKIDRERERERNKSEWKIRFVNIVIHTRTLIHTHETVQLIFHDFPHSEEKEEN